MCSKSQVTGVFVLGFFGPSLVMAQPASAALISGFTGPFSPATWIPDPAIPVFVDASAAPASISLAGPDDGSGAEVAFAYSSAPLPSENYAVSFQWSYASADNSAANDQFGYFLNAGPFVNLSDPLGALSQSGFFKIVANPGDSLSFAIVSSDGLGGAATTVISSFLAGLPSEVPDCPPCVPGPLPLLGAAIGFRLSRTLRRRRRITSLLG